MGGRRLEGMAIEFLGAHLITFVLLFVVFSALADGRSGPADASGLPFLVNPALSGSAQITETILFSRGVMVLAGDFGVDHAGRAILDEVLARLPLSLSLIGALVLVVVIVAALGAAGWVAGELKLAARWRRLGLPLGLVMAVVAGALPLQWLVDGMWRFVLPGQPDAQGAHFVFGLSLVLGMAAGRWWVRNAWDPLWRGAATGTALLLGLDRRTVMLGGVVPGALRRGISALAGLIGMLFALDLLLETVFEVRGLGRYAVEAFHGADVAVLQVLILMGVAVRLLIRMVVGRATAELPLAPVSGARQAEA